MRGTVARSIVVLAGIHLCFGIGAPAALGAANDIFINDVTVTEGDGGTVNAVFTVTRETPNLAANVMFDVQDGDGVVGPSPATLADGDYIDQSGTLIFGTAETTEMITVQIVGDLRDEFDETYLVVLTGTTAGTIVKSDGVGTITDNDPMPTISIGDLAFAEGNPPGFTPINFNVSLSAASGKTVMVDFESSPGTALQPADYLQESGSRFFNPGVTTSMIPVNVIRETLAEPDETFSMNLSSPVNATLADSSGVATILDDDTPPPNPESPTPPPAATGPTGQRAAALKRCARIKNKKRKKACKRRARRLPV